MACCHTISFRIMPLLARAGFVMVQGMQAGDPEAIGPYRLFGRLGNGGMGLVFLGRSAGGRPVAVKVIRPELSGDSGFRARFRREVVAARRVNGLFTALVVDADADGPVPWLATAYIAGPSLDAAVTEHGPLPADSVLALAAGLAEGLIAIHAAGVLHRDLKPSNVLLADDGPRVIDFGISRAAEDSALTHSGLAVGTAGYMSPEQAEGQEVGPATDVFSLGAVLTFAATGRGPFGGGSTAALIYRVVHSPPNLDDVPGQVRPVIERCLAKDPAQRPGPGQLLAGLSNADRAAGWLPAQIAEALPWYLPPAPASFEGNAGPAARPVTEPALAPGALPSRAAGAQPTITTARRHATPDTASGSPQPGSPPRSPPRHRGRNALLALLLAGAAASAGTVLALHRAAGRPTAAQHGHKAAGSPTSRPAGEAPAPPAHVVATALSQYTIRVSWSDKSADVTGFNVSNGCGTDGCNGGALNKRTGPVTATDVTTTPGAFQCFSVQAFNSSGTSASKHQGCTSTPGLNIPVTREWTDTGVTVRSGAAVGISAAGEVYLAAAGSSQPPGGNPSCTPTADYVPHSSQFPAPELPCWSLIARIGNSPPFEVGTSILVTATTGRLYLGVNDDSFSGNAGIWAVNIKIGSLP